MQPREGAFEPLAEDAQAAPVGGASLRQDRENAEAAQGVPMGRRVVGAVALDMVGAGSRMAHFAMDRRDGLDQGEGLRHVVAVGFGDPRRQGGAVAIGDQVMFAP